MSLELEYEERDKVIKLFKDHIVVKHNCRVGWAMKEIAGQKYEKSFHNLDKIANAIIESGEYSKERPTGVNDDWNIFKHSQYKLAQINKKSVIINTIIGALTFFALIASIIITLQSYKAEQSFEQKVERQLDILSKKNKETNPSKDSLSMNKMNSIDLQNDEP